MILLYYYFTFCLVVCYLIIWNKCMEIFQFTEAFIYDNVVEAPHQHSLVSTNLTECNYFDQFSTVNVKWTRRNKHKADLNNLLQKINFSQLCELVW